MANPVVTFEMENGDIMKAELYPEIAPNTVNNFVSLVKKRFFMTGLIFSSCDQRIYDSGGDARTEPEWAVRDIRSKVSLHRMV